MSAGTGGRQPAQIVESGPAGGVIAGVRLGEASGAARPDLPRHGRHDRQGRRDRGRRAVADQRVRGRARGSRCRASCSKGRGYALKLPVLDIAEVGAGGGSIVVADRSARSWSGRTAPARCPGPVCYGAGGDAADGHRRQRRPRLRQPGGDRGRQPRRSTRTSRAGRSTTTSPRRWACRSRTRRTACSGSRRRRWPARSRPSPRTAAATRATSRCWRSVATARSSPPRWPSRWGCATSSSRRRPACSRRWACSRPRRRGTSATRCSRWPRDRPATTWPRGSATLESGLRDGAGRAAAPSTRPSAWGADVRYAGQGYEPGHPGRARRAAPASLVERAAGDVPCRARAGLWPRGRARRDRARQRPRDRPAAARRLAVAGDRAPTRRRAGSRSVWFGPRLGRHDVPVVGRAALRTPIAGPAWSRSSTRRRSCRPAGRRVLDEQHTIVHGARGLMDAAPGPSAPRRTIRRRSRSSATRWARWPTRWP